jgi:hypothetical protein
MFRRFAFKAAFSSAFAAAFAAAALMALPEAAWAQTKLRVSSGQT